MRACAPRKSSSPGKWPSCCAKLSARPPRLGSACGRARQTKPSAASATGDARPLSPILRRPSPLPASRRTSPIPSRASWWTAPAGHTSRPITPTPPWTRGSQVIVAASLTEGRQRQAPSAAAPQADRRGPRRASAEGLRRQRLLQRRQSHGSRSGGGRVLRASGDARAEVCGGTGHACEARQ